MTTHRERIQASIAGHVHHRRDDVRVLDVRPDVGQWRVGIEHLPQMKLFETHPLPQLSERATQRQAQPERELQVWGDGFFSDFDRSKIAPHSSMHATRFSSPTDAGP